MAERLAGKPTQMHTARLLLRPFAATDAGEMSVLLADQRVAETYALPRFDSAEEALPLFWRLRALSGQAEHFIYGAFAGGRLIGFLNDVAVRGEEIEVGYVIAPAYWRQGYATEMLAACIDALFALGFSCVTAGFFEGNEASRRVMEKCGMRPACKCERIVYRGRERECVYYERRKTRELPEKNKVP